MSDPALRASDADREAVVRKLHAHAADGRLDPVELEDRVSAALRARTGGELDALLEDLPAARGGHASHRASGVREHLLVYVAVQLMLVAIWALGGGGEFWPAWVMVWWAFALVMKSGPQLLRLR